VTERSQSDETGRRVERHALVRNHNLHILLETILRGGNISRVELAELTGLSKPTVNVLVRELTSLGLVVRAGIRGGSVGRTAELYRAEPNAGMVLAVDVGANRLRGATSNLFGEVLSERFIDAPRRGHLVRGIDSLARQLFQDAPSTTETLWVGVVGAPGVVDPSTGKLSLSMNIPDLMDLHLADVLGSLWGCPVVVDNDVNLAAVGELQHGCAKGIDNFAFLSIGNGVGLGAVVNGEVVRGSRGAAGEVGYLPLGDDPFGPASRRRGSLEEIAGAAGIRVAARRLRASGVETLLGSRPTVEQIFEAAELGDPLGRAVLDREARLLALAAMSISATLDPQVLILGGGVGGNPALVALVQKYLNELSPFAIEVRPSELRGRAALFGALSVGLDRLRTTLLALSHSRINTSGASAR